MLLVGIETDFTDTIPLRAITILYVSEGIFYVDIFYVYFIGYWESSIH